MKSASLGSQLGYWGTNPRKTISRRVKTAEGLGYDSVWTAEAYGSDALTPLAWVGAHTSEDSPGHGVPAFRAPAMAWQRSPLITFPRAASCSVSAYLGPRWWGWYGRPFAKLARTRNTSPSSRRCLPGKSLSNDGEHTLPTPGKEPGASASP